MERKKMGMRKYIAKGTSVRRRKRWFALLLCLCLIGTTVTVTARAEESGSAAAGLCKHHPQHTAESGCLVSDCPHENGEHDDTCGYVEASGGSPCTFACDICGDEAGPEEQEPAGNNLSDAARCAR